MNYIIDFFTNEILVSAIVGWAVAQLLKTILHLYVTKEFVAERLVGTGGMPSSHSATVCGLATAVGINYGLGSVEFAIAGVLAIIVMYDALGVRREAGRQAKVLNEMLDYFSSVGKKMTAQERLKEFVGHTPLQVIVGATIGIGLAFVVCLVIFK
ncbi:MAG: divergent PAP2 family protein [Lachnospiraceae bacterium]